MGVPVSEESKQYVVADDFEQLVSLFYSDIYFLAMELLQDEEMAKGVAKKVFELAETRFDKARNNSLAFVEGILRRMTTYVKSDEGKMQESGIDL